MTRVGNSIADLVGNTPIVKLNRLTGPEDAEVYLKLEFFNPSSSVKDRIALSMIEAGEREGKLKLGDTIIEPTSGNTGIGLAMIAAAKGYKSVLVMPETMSMERRNLLRAYGADLVLTPGPEGMKGAIAKATDLARENGWFMKMIHAVNQKEENIHSLTERVEPKYLSDSDGRDEEINPHAFIDPAVGVKMAEDLRDALAANHPTDGAKIQEQGDAYVKRLIDLDKEFEARIGSIPEENRVLVTSERAFQYLNDHYGLKEAFIWEIDTEENGSPKQIKALVNYIQEHKVPVLFVESNVDSRPMETVSKESGVPIANKPIYSDEIGNPGDEIDTYIKYLEYNMELIYNELSKKR